MATKKLADGPHEAAVSLAYFQIENPGQPAVPSDQSPANRRTFNVLVRTGYAMRYEFDDRRFGWRLTASGLEYVVATEPDEFHFTDEAVSA